MTKEEKFALKRRLRERYKGDLISRQAVLDSLKEHRALYCDNTPETFSKLSYAEKSRVDELDTVIATIINLPSVENKGEWVRDTITDLYHCSICRGICHQDPKSKDDFCKFCGADMRGGNETDN